MKTFDFEAMLARCLGRVELVDRALTRFKPVVQADLEKLERAIGGGEATEIARIAHRLKGASSNVSALRVQAQAAKLEELAQNLEVETNSSCLDLLQELELLQEEVSRFTQCAATGGQTERAR
jgi:HPt (histidine-containing phosphotransfer) domain-containing protein